MTEGWDKAQKSHKQAEPCSSGTGLQLCQTFSYLPGTLGRPQAEASSSAVWGQGDKYTSKGDTGHWHRQGSCSLEGKGLQLLQKHMDIYIEIKIYF